jgi:LmbE family N-acetylglucosaminyl deacetylase
MRWIYVSPHFDDAVLSCGGLIYEQCRQGLAVEIWTICAGVPPAGTLSPFAQEMHRQWGTSSAEETVNVRRQEDQQAGNVLGASVRHFNTPDCIYRRSRQGTALYTEDVFVPRHPLESGLDRAIAGALRRQLQDGDVLVCPLGIGCHVDHLLTRAAVERLDRRTCYYADIPYLLSRPESLPEAISGLKENVYQVSGMGLQAWQLGIACYLSQLKVLFESQVQMRSAIQEYWMVVPGLRLWEA